MIDAGEVPSVNRARRRSRRRRGTGIHQLSWTQPVNRYPKLDLLSEEEVSTIHDYSLRILEDIGHHQLGVAQIRMAQNVATQVATSELRALQIRMAENTLIERKHAGNDGSVLVEQGI